MVRQDWGLHGECIRCGKPSTHWFKKGWLFGSQRLAYCKDCLHERLKEEKIEVKATYKVV